MRLVGAMVATRSLTHEVAGLKPFTAMTNIFSTEYSQFNEIIQRKLNCLGTPCVCASNLLFGLPQRRPL